MGAGVSAGVGVGVRGKVCHIRLLNKCNYKEWMFAASHTCCIPEGAGVGEGVGEGVGAGVGAGVGEGVPHVS